MMNDDRLYIRPKNLEKNYIDLKEKFWAAAENGGERWRWLFFYVNIILMTLQKRFCPAAVLCFNIFILTHKKDLL